MSLKESLAQSKGRYGFIPISKLRELVTYITVQSHLELQGVKISKALKPNTVVRSRRLFAILILLALECHIENVLDNGITDDIFPAQESDLSILEDDEDRHRFLVEQWTIPLPFHPEQNMNLPRDAILPFLSKEKINYGTFGIVYRVRVADGHLINYQGCDIAMKSIEFNDATDTAIMREIVALRRRPHENIVPLLSSFMRSSTESSIEIKSLNLLFPYADMDMERWLNLKETPIEYAESTREVQRIDLYKSTYALLSALAFLHRESADDGLSASHYDIKPKNILVFGKKWMIADFGLARLHSSVGGSETDGIGGLGSYDYHPPEYYNDDGTRAEKRHGRAFDVWPMGCIMLQVAVLIVSGWEKGRIEEFRRSRSELSTNLRRFRKRTDGKDSSFHNSLEAIDDWIGKLQADGSPMLLQFLQIIIQMLRGDPKDRLASWEVELDLYEMLFPDHSISQRLEMSKTRIPQNDKPDHGTATFMPLRRATLRGNAVRAVCLLEAGWRLDSKHLNHQDWASFGIADPNNRASILETLRGSHGNHMPNAISEFRKNVLTPSPIHAKEHNGFQINQGSISLEIDNFVDMPLSNVGCQVLLERDSQHRTIIHRAARHNEYEMLQGLSNSPQWNEAVGLKDDYGRTCLHYASERHSADVVVQFILQKSPSPVALVLEEDQWGQTALHIAAARGNFLIAKILLDVVDDKPALVAQEDANRKTPVQLAGSSGDSELRQYLWELRDLK